MQKTVIEKIGEGKIIRITLDFSDKIRDIKITGDFSVTPEYAIENIEKALVGMKFSSSEELIRKRMDYTAKKLRAEFTDFDTVLIARTIKNILSQ